MTGPPPKNISFDNDEKDQIYHPEFVTNADMGEFVITSEGYLRDARKVEVGSLAMDDFQDALKAYQQSLEVFINNKGLEAPTVEEVGEAWANLDALKAYQQSLELFINNKGLEAPTVEEEVGEAWAKLDALKAYQQSLEVFINNKGLEAPTVEEVFINNKGLEAPTVEEVGEAWAKLDLILRLPLANASTRSAEAKEAARLILRSPTTTDDKKKDLLNFEHELEKLIADHVMGCKLQAASLAKKSRLMDAICVVARLIDAKIKERESLLRKKQRLDEKIANLQADRDATVVALEQSKKCLDPIIADRDATVVALEQSKKRSDHS